MGTFTTKNLQEVVKDGKLNILKEGETIKFVKQIQQITFSAKNALANNQEILYITERAVFKLTKQGLELIEKAPGVDLEKDILQKMAFRPIISKDLKEMDNRIFREEKMALTV